ncbi:MAG: hypothetical protein ABIY48_10145, partial [Acidimicrobiales bacterium]
MTEILDAWQPLSAKHRESPEMTRLGYSNLVVWNRIVGTMAAPRSGAPQRGAAEWGRRFLPEGRALPTDVWQRRHNVIITLLWLHVLGVACFGLARGYNAVHSLLEASLVGGLAILASWAGAKPRLRTVAATLSLLTASAVLVHLSGGSTEMHFHFFVMIGVIT